VIAGAPVVVCTAHAPTLREPNRLAADAVIGRAVDVDALVAGGRRVDAVASANTRSLATMWAMTR